MAFGLSPGVYPQMTDLSTTVPAVGTNTAALVGYSPRGTLDVNLITNAQQFIEEYGKPDIAVSYFHYTALAFLENGTRLYCKRVTGDNALYSGISIVDNVTGTAHRGLSVGASSPTSFSDESGYSDELFTIYAKDPGVWGDSLAITISDVKALLDDGGSTLDTTEQYTFAINVYYTDTDGNQNKVESWKVSRQNKIDGYGKNLYLETKINGYSKYILVADNTAQADTVLPLESTADTATYAVDLGGGSDGDAVVASDIIGSAGDSSGWYAFQNPDNVEIQLMLDGGHTPTIESTPSSVASIQTAMKTIAEARRDCFCIFSVPYSECADPNDTLAYRNTTLNLNSSYCGLYAPWCKINDGYNDKIVEIPPTGYVASQFALTDATRDVWYAPAGYERGTLNILGLTYVYSEGERDMLYPAGVNTLQTFRGYGHVIWGQKTLQKKSSALDRINVRRLLLMMEKAIVALLRAFLFENNTELTRFTVKATLDSYMEGLSAAGAFQTEAGDNGFLVICDTTNNTPAVIDANELRVDVFCKPVRCAEYIRLQTIVTKSGTSFTELISRGTIL